jgi:hypothetical protein
MSVFGKKYRLAIRFIFTLILLLTRVLRWDFASIITKIEIVERVLYFAFGNHGVNNLRIKYVH